MKYLKIDLSILTCILLFAGTSVFAQQESDVKKEKKVVIVTKTVDENGNEITKKIIKKGDDADVFIMKNDEGHGMHKRVEVNVDDSDGENQVKIRIKNGEGDEDVEVIEWSGDGEIPAEMLKRLEEKGINLEMKGDKNVFHLDMDQASNKACLGVMIGMKESVENINGEETTTTEGTSDEGVPVLNIIDGSGAADAGLLKDDIITQINGSEVASIQDVLDLLSPFDAGETVNIDYLRNGQESQVTATLKACGNHSSQEIEEEFEWTNEDGNGINLDGNNWVFIDEEGNQTKGKNHKVIIKKHKNGEGQEVIIKEIELDQDGENSFTFEGKNTLDLETIDIFPNPTDGRLRLKFTAPKGATVVKVTDISGKEVYSEDLNSFDGNYDRELDLSKASKGALILSIHQGDKVFSEKIILQR